jgi:hypothetical protein
MGTSVSPCTKGGVVRLDATITYSDECEVDYDLAAGAYTRSHFSST